MQLQIPGQKLKIQSKPLSRQIRIFLGIHIRIWKIHQIVIPYFVRIFHRFSYLNPFSDFNIHILSSFLKGVFQSVHSELVCTPCYEGHPVACHFPTMFFISRFGKIICGKSVQRFQPGTLADVIQAFECQLICLPGPGLSLRIPQQNFRITNDSVSMVIAHVLAGSL